jgi:hypothetical protein
MGAIQQSALVNHIASNIRRFRLLRNYSQDYLGFKQYVATGKTQRQPITFF